MNIDQVDRQHRLVGRWLDSGHTVLDDPSWRTISASSESCNL